MKPPPVSKAQILKGLRSAHDRFTKAEAEARAASERTAAQAPNTPEWEAAAKDAFAARERVLAEVWRLVGAVEFYIGVIR